MNFHGQFNTNQIVYHKFQMTSLTSLVLYELVLMWMFWGTKGASPNYFGKSNVIVTFRGGGGGGLLCLMFCDRQTPLFGTLLYDTSFCVEIV